MVVIKVGGRVVPEDHVVYRYAQVKATFVVEVDHLIGAIGWLLVADIRKGATVAHGLQSRALHLIEAKELAYAHTVEAVTLGDGVLPGRTREAVDDRLGKKQPVKGGCGERLVGVTVISLAHAVDRTLLSDEVETWVDLILTVREEELHLSLAFSWT
jgi:hypothetical protein